MLRCHFFNRKLTNLVVLATVIASPVIMGPGYPTFSEELNKILIDYFFSWIEKMTKQKLRDKIALYPAELDFGLIKENKIEREEIALAIQNVSKSSIRRDGPFCQSDRSVNRTVLSIGPFCQWQNGLVKQDRSVEPDRSVKSDRSVQTDRSVNQTVLSLTEWSYWQNGPVYRTVRLTERSVSPTE